MEALKETVDSLFQQAVEEGCYTEDRAARAGGKPGHLQSVAGGPVMPQRCIPTSPRKARNGQPQLPGRPVPAKLLLLYGETDQVTMESWWLPAWSCGSWKICPWRLSPA